MPDFDLAVIGAGAAGLSVASVAAQLGLAVALIERGRMGGDCLNYGCVPSKALLAAAHAARSARAASRYGIGLPPPVIDWAGVQAHVRRAIEAIAPTDSAERYTGLGATVLRDEARFVAPDTLGVGGRRLGARRIVIAAGSCATIPDIPGLDTAPFLTNETLFGIAEAPSHLLILGGGPVGVEMAQAHAGLGCRVTIVQSGSLLPKEEPELVARLRDRLVEEGVTVMEHAAACAAEAGPTLVLSDGRRVGGSHLLIAAGRVPNLGALALDAGQVRAGPGGILTDRGLRSVSNRRVYAVGDIADPAGLGPRAFTHAASYHAGLVVRRALFRLPATLDYRSLPRVTYTDPELAQVGLTEAEARAAGHVVTTSCWDLAENDRAIAEGETIGLVKLVMARGRLLGGGILSPAAGEMAGLLGLAIGRRVPVSALAGMIVPYPTRAEAVKRAAGEVYRRRLFASRTKALVRFLARLP